MLRIGIVSDNVDPLKQRRVRVSSVDRGTGVSDWLPRLTAWDGSDLGVPPVGATVIISDLDGASDTQIVIGVLQSSTSNQPSSKPGLGDWFGTLAGSLVWVMTGAWDFLAERTISLRKKHPVNPSVNWDDDGSITVRNDLGTITLLPTGYLRITDPSGDWVTGIGGLSVTHPTQISFNSPSLTYNGQQVAIVGGTDTRGDTTLS